VRTAFIIKYCEKWNSDYRSTR